VRKLVTALAAIAAIETPYRLTNDVASYFRTLGATRRDERGDVLRNIAEPIDVARVERVLPAGHRALLHDTIVLTMLSAGASPNSIPATASALVDIRLLPDESSRTMLEKVRAAAGGNADVEVLLSSEPVRATAVDTDLYRTLARVMRAAEPGSAVMPIVISGTSDSRFFREKGIVAYGISPFKVNYYDVGTAHAGDERIRARFFTEGVHVMREMVRAFCAR
jgi:acetylornithine deacetylase/succinyl-diaminopimelate desuccinylase-like protein